MRILFDTNIFINREDDHIVSKDLQDLLSILNTIGAAILLHPTSLEDIQRDQNLDRRNVMLSKLGTYQQLLNPPQARKDEAFLKIIASRNNDHDKIDNEILYALYKDAVDFLVTQDKEIHKKAFKLGLDERVLVISDAAITFQSYLSKESVIAPPALKKEFAYNLNLADPFFASEVDPISRTG